MLVSRNWLGEFIKIPSSEGISNIAEKLTLSGLEVESISPYSKNQDEILDICITPNRGDALSHIGIARELSSLYNLPISRPQFTCREMGHPIDNFVRVNIYDKESCPRYACKIVEGVSIAKSPKWLSNRLESLGIRSVNNIVDITNYVLLEIGQPMHAFDYSLLSKKNNIADINIRKAKKGEKLKTLDGKEYNLSADDLVVADNKEIVSLAGVMGGANTEISKKTKDILLESAHFLPEPIRKTARKHSISTESSYRFERGCDPDIVVRALERAATMITKLAGGKIMRGSLDCYPSPIKPKEISLDLEFLKRFSGLNSSLIRQDRLRQLLLQIGIETIRKDNNKIYFRVPAFRHDISREQDLIEEVMRLVGYDKVPVRVGYVYDEIRICKENILKNKFFTKLRNSALSNGFSEVINYSFSSLDINKLFIDKEDSIVKIINPLGVDLSSMRVNLISGLLSNIYYNQNRNKKDLALFEIANTFRKRKKSNISKSVSINSLDNLSANSWALEIKEFSAISSKKSNIKKLAESENQLYLDLKGRIVSILQSLGFSSSYINGEIDFVLDKDKLSFLHPGKSASIIYKPKLKKIGYIGVLHPHILEFFKIESACCALNINIDELIKYYKPYKTTKKISKYPCVVRDLSVIIKNEITISSLLNLVGKATSKISDFHSINIFDIYKGKNLGEDKKSIGLNLTFLSDSQTLKDDSINKNMSIISKILKEKLGAEIRL